MKKSSKIFLGIFCGLTAAAVTGLTVAKAVIKQPASTAVVALAKAEIMEDSYYFPSEDQKKPMIIFYPGAGVDVGSYSVWAEKVSAAGYPVFLVNMPLQLAFFASDRADKILAAYPDRDYIMAGHSLGGAMSSRFAAKKVETDPHLKGIIYMSSYTLDSKKLRNSQLPALVFTATEDKDITEKDVMQKKADYPQKAEFVSIKGGNHLGFGSVKDAQPSSISNEEQQEAVTEALLDWLEQNF